MLASCAGTKEPEHHDIFPAQHKIEIQLLLGTTLEDPTNIRDAMISDPVLNPAAPIKRYYLCLKYNPREPNTKRYTGITEQVAVFHNGHLNQLIAATPELCGRAAYKPYPELQKLCFGTKCD